MDLRTKIEIALFIILVVAVAANIILAAMRL